MNKIREYLKEAFVDWQTEKLCQHITYAKDIDETLLKELSLNRDEFIEKYLNIYNGLSKEQIQKIFNILSVFLQKDSESFYTVSISIDIISLKNAIDWTSIYMSHIFGLTPRCKPVNQCHYCGSIADYSYIDNMHQKHDCSFDSVTKFCHVDGCIPTNENKNYSAHPNCCYGVLEKIKHRKRIQYKGKYRTKEENINDFLNLCEMFFQDRLKNAQYTVQHIDRHGNLIKAIPRSEWGKELFSWQEYIEVNQL